ncbi:9792_t:CDS:2 [Ambispora gerdemannii]|uniref:Peroxidase n=1 Tax=Ambispora gerdemannii TaxID=144530 RepID=A0A9N9GBC9_9GLOM|nr:9792_t:CDS:2 [Ambispora gerdemannii]
MSFSSFRLLRAVSRRELYITRPNFTASTTTLLNFPFSFTNGTRAAALPFSKTARAFSTATEEKSGGGGSKLVWIAAGLVGAGAGYYIFSTQQIIQKVEPLAEATPPPKKEIDYQSVYNQIADILEDNDYDDGSYGPVLLRLAWHSSGTYDKETGTGGSNGATMRFAQEGGYGANAGLNVARDKLESIKEKNPEISYSDLWTLAGVVAIQELGGPTIPWRPGRVDADVSLTTPDGRLPDAEKGAKHIRDIFYRMGFDDREIVALIGAHALGRCHPTRSGFDGPWTSSPTVFTNDFFKELLNKKWVEKKWKGPKQYVDKQTGNLMMLPADLAFIQDKSFKSWVEKYAKDEQLYFKDFAEAFTKLLELGVPFTGNEKVYTFKPTTQ